MASARVPFLLLLLLLVDIAASARVAVLIYGHHPSLLTEHKALVFTPLEAVATVDVFVVGNNRSKSFPDLVSAYASLRPSSSEGLFASAGSVDGSTASAAFLLSGLRLLERTAQSHPQLLVQQGQGRQRRGHGRGLDVGGARVRKQRETTSRYGTGAFVEMEAALRGQGTDDGVT